MKWLGWVIGSLLVCGLVIISIFMMPFLYIIFSIVFSLIVFFSFKKGYDLKKSLFFVGIFAFSQLVFSLVVWFIVRSLSNNLASLSDGGVSGSLMTSFFQQSIFVLVISAVLFFVVPFALSYVKK